MAITFENFFRGLAEAGPAWASILLKKSAFNEDVRRYGIEQARADRGEKRAVERHGLEKELLGKQILASDKGLERDQVEIETMKEGLKQFTDQGPYKLGSLKLEVALKETQAFLGDVSKKYANKTFEFFSKQGTTPDIEDFLNQRKQLEIHGMNATTERQKFDLTRMMHALDVMTLVTGVAKKDSKLASEISDMLSKTDTFEDGMRNLGSFLVKNPEVGTGMLEAFKGLDTRFNEIKRAAYNDLAFIMSNYPLKTKTEGGFLGFGGKQVPDFEGISKMNDKQRRNAFNDWASGAGGMLARAANESYKGTIDINGMIEKAYFGKFQPSFGTTDEY